MRKLIFLLGSLVVLGIGAVLIVPGMINWNSYRADISREASRFVGRDVVISGDISARMIPVPALEAADVTVANRPGGQAEKLASLKALSIRISPFALLTGSVKVSSVKLVEPVVNLEKFPDGVGNWVDTRAGGGQAAGGESTGGESAGGQSEGGGVSITIDDFSIENGVLVYRDLGTGEEHRVENLNGRFSAGSLKGPFAADGSLAYNGLPIAFAAEVDELVDNQPVTVDVETTVGDDQGTFALDGTITQRAEGISAAGQISVKTDNLAALIALLAPKSGPQPLLAQAFALEGALSLSPTEAGMKSLRLSLGDSEITGDARVTLGEKMNAAIDLKSDMLDLDPVLAALEAQGQKDAPAPKDPAPTAQAAAPGPMLPAGLSGEANLAIKALKVKGDTIRDVKVNAMVGGQTVTLKAVQAVLPGESGLSMAGVYDLTKGQLDGAMKFKSNGPRRMIDWLGVDTGGALAPGKPESAALEAEFSVRPDLATIKSFKLQLDKSDLYGAANIRLAGRLGIGANLRFETLDLDSLLAQAPAKPAGDQAAAEQPADSAGANPLAGLAVLNTLDANIKGGGKLLVYQGRRVENIGFDATLVKGVLTLNQVGAVAEGVSVSSKGVLSNFGAMPNAKDFRVGVGTGDGMTLLKLANVKLGGPPPKLGKTQINLNLNGGLMTPSVQVAVNTAGGQFTASGTLDLQKVQQGLSLRLGAKHPNLPGLLRRLNIDNKAGKDTGGIDLSADVAYAPDKVVVRNLAGAVGKTKLKGNITYVMGGKKPSLAAAVNFGQVNLNPFLGGGGGQSAGGGQQGGKGGRWSREPIDFGWMNAMDLDLTVNMGALIYKAYVVKAVTMKAQMTGGVLTLKTLSGKLFEGGLKASGSLNGGSGAYRLVFDYSKGQLGSLSKALSGAVRSTGTASMKADLGGRGRSELEMVSTLSGQGNMVANNVRAGENSKGGIAEILTMMANPLGIGGTQPVANLSAPFAAKNGIFQFDPVQIKSNIGDGAARATVDLPRWLIDAKGQMTLNQNIVLSQFTSKEKIVVPFDLSGPLDRPTPNVQMSALQNLKLPGKGGAAVNELLKNVVPQGQQQGGGGAVNELLKNVVPQGQQQPTGQQQPAGQQQPSPEQQLLNDLLNLK